MKIRIAAERVLTQPGRLAALGRSSVEVDGGLISAVHPAAERGDGLLIMPALVNAHDHGHGLRPFTFGAGDQALEMWLAMLPLEPIVDPYLRAATAFGRLAASGVAAINHCHSPQRPRELEKEAETISRAARDVGVRVAFGMPLRDRNHAVYGSSDALVAAIGEADFGAIMKDEVRASPEEQLDLVEAVSAFEHALFGVQFSPAGPEWCSDELLEAIAAASERTGRRIHMHLLETHTQREWADAQYPGGLVIQRLDEIGSIQNFQAQSGMAAVYAAWRTIAIARLDLRWICGIRLKKPQRPAGGRRAP